MSSKAKPVGDQVVVAVDGKPTNRRFQNMFEEEIILTEKQKLRKEMLENKDKMKEKLKTMTAIDIFLLFDEDDSGLISFEEFRKLLPYLDIAISDAKAFRYFRMCDSDGSGEIDVDEFQVALFACDPVSASSIFVSSYVVGSLRRGSCRF
jgi:Ca2+-binding EF-hand superfamily protein